MHLLEIIKNLYKYKTIIPSKYSARCYYSSWLFHQAPSFQSPKRCRPAFANLPRGSCRCPGRVVLRAFHHDAGVGPPSTSPPGPRPGPRLKLRPAEQVIEKPGMDQTRQPCRVRCPARLLERRENIGGKTREIQIQSGVKLTMDRCRLVGNGIVLQ